MGKFFWHSLAITLSGLFATNCMALITQATTLDPSFAFVEPYELKCTHNSLPGTFQFSAIGHLTLSPLTATEGAATGTLLITVLPPGNDSNPTELEAIQVTGQWKRIPPGQLGREAVDQFTLRPVTPDTSPLVLAQLLINYPEPGKSSSSIRLSNGQLYRARCDLTN